MQPDVARAGVVDGEHGVRPDLVEGRHEARVVVDLSVLGNLEHQAAGNTAQQGAQRLARHDECRRCVHVEPGRFGQGPGGREGGLKRRDLQFQPQVDRLG